MANIDLRFLSIVQTRDEVIQQATQQASQPV